jgi:hypothetical protein
MLRGGVYTRWQAKVGEYLLIRGPVDGAETFYIGKVLHKTATHYGLQWWVREHDSAWPLEAAYLPQENHVGCRRANLEQLLFDAQCIQDVVKMVRGPGGEGRKCLSRQGMIRVIYWQHQWGEKSANDSDSDDDVSFTELGLSLRQGDPNSDPDDNVSLHDLVERRRNQHGVADSGSLVQRGVASSIKEESQENDIPMREATEVREFDCQHQTLARCQILEWGRRGKARSVTLKLEEGEYIETFANIKGNKLLSYKICVRGGRGASGIK